jgi:1-aminocyclopropane-1-carboxylate deaminase/D-cysteine desulfhydrase-like pyridoxal-dependent ACC family enzyme
MPNPGLADTADLPTLPAALPPRQLRTAMEQLPRVALSHLPTPLEPLPRFSSALGGPLVFIKRDDCTGLCLGGNKARHNEFLFGDALHNDCDLFVWGAGLQSNNCRQTAAACARLGLDCHLLLSRRGYSDADVRRRQGNLLLDQLVGAVIEVVDEEIGPALDARLAELAKKYQDAGRRPYVWNRPRVLPRAAASYAICAAEIAEQCKERGIEPRAVYVSSAGSTGAGLVLGAKSMQWSTAVRCIAPMQWPWDTAAEMAATAQAAADLANIPIRVYRGDVDITFDHIASGYGECSPDGLEAMMLLARSEGILVDPIYSGKALAGLVADVRRKMYGPSDVIVFIHTGGTPALFSYAHDLATGIPERRAPQSR